MSRWSRAWRRADSVVDFTDEEKAGATPLEVIDQNEAKQRQDSGGFTADGHYAGPAMVDMNTPAPGGRPVTMPAAAAPKDVGWAVSNDEVNASIGAKPILPAQANVQPRQEPSGLDVAAAAFRESNLLSAAVDRWMNHPDATVPDVPGYSPFDNNSIAGFEQYANRFVDSGSPQQTQVIKERIASEQRDKQTIAQAGGAGMAASLAAGIVDPVSITLMIIPGLGEIGLTSRVGRIGAVVATNVAAGEVQQAALTQLKETTNYSDGIIPRIGANALLAGVLGTLATRVPKAEFKTLTEGADTAINPVVPTESTGGAAAVRGTTLEQESFATGGSWVAKADAKLPRWLASPTMRVMSSSPVVESRRLIQKIVDIGGGMLNKNKEGIATPTSVEMVSNQLINSREAQMIRAHDDAFAEHAAEAGANTLSKHDFGAEVLKALSNGDKHEIPQVAAVAKAVRPFFDADHEMLQKIAPDADYNMLTKTAESYAPRVWDNSKITADRTAFEQFLHNHFTNQPRTAEVPEATVTMAPAKLGEGTSKSFIDEFHEQNPEPSPVGFAGKRIGKANVDLSTDPFDPNKVHLEMLRADEMGKGQGSRALKKVLALADKHGVTVQLDAVPVGKGGPDAAKLMEFYREHGFKPPTEPSGPTTMVREGLNDRMKAVETARQEGPVDQLVKVSGQRVKLDAAIEKEKSAGLSDKLKELEAERAKLPTDAEINAAHEKEQAAAEKRIAKEHEASQPVETMKQPGVGPPKPLFREPAEVSAAVQDTIDNIQHATRGTADIGTGVRNPKSSKARVLDVTDEAARPWLSDDFEGTMKAYLRSMMPHIEMHRQFGSVTLDTELQQIGDAYRVKMAGAADDAAKDVLVKQRESDIQDLMLMRDRVLGQAGPKNNESIAVVRAAQIVRSMNYLRSLGGQIFSAIPDIGRVIARYGMTDTSTRIAQFLGNSDLRNMAKEDMQRLGTALDVVLHTREHSLEGAGNALATGDKLNKMAQGATAKFTKYSMIAHWDASIRLLSAQLEQDAIAKLVNGETISAFEKAKLAAHGIGDADIDAIRGQWNLHGSNENGLNRARTELWSDKEAAGKVEQAVQRAASTNAFFIGKGDVPAFADSQFGKFMFQFKGFVMGSVMRLALPLAQGLAHGDVKAANGLAMMLSLGGVRYYLKEKAAGREPDLSPRNLSAEMLMGSGVLTFLPDMYDPLAAIVHLPRFSKFQDHGWEETLGGPSMGEISILSKTISSMTGGHMNAQDMHKLRQLLPYQNMFYLNRLFNMVEGKTSDAFDLKNAAHRPALDYLNPTKDSEVEPRNPDPTHFLGIKSIPNSQI